MYLTSFCSQNNPTKQTLSLVLFHRQGNEETRSLAQAHPTSMEQSPSDSRASASNVYSPSQYPHFTKEETSKKGKVTCPQSVTRHGLWSLDFLIQCSSSSHSCRILIQEDTENKLGWKAFLKSFLLPLLEQNPAWAWAQRGFKSMARTCNRQKDR